MVVVILFAAGLANLILTKDTYVFLSFEQYSFATSLWFFIVAVLVSLFFLRYITRFLRLVLRPKKSFEDWAYARRVSASKRDFYQALIDFELGAWDKALKRFRAAAENLDRPLVAQLYAARTAQKLGREDFKEEFLQEALKSEPKSALAIGLVRAELLNEAGEKEAAKKVLQSLQQASPKNLQVSNLLEMVAVA